MIIKYIFSQSSTALFMHMSVKIPNTNYSQKYSFRLNYINGIFTAIILDKS